MVLEEFIPAAEAILFLEGDAVDMGRMAELLGISVIEADTVISMLKERLVERGSGLELINVNNSVQLIASPAQYAFTSKLKAAPEAKTLSAAALEVLSVVAYRQPVTKGEVERVRGVACGEVMKRLYESGLLRQVGVLDVPGKPKLYGTTDFFLKTFGLTSLMELPPLNQEDELNPGSETESEEEFPNV